MTSQGDASIHADDARLDFGVDGTGVRIGILTDSLYATADVSGTVTDSLAVTKTAAPPSVTAPSGMVTFIVRIDNLDVDTVEINSLTDDVHGNLHGQGTCAVTQFIPVGGSYTAAVAGSAGSTETSTVTASGFDNLPSPISGSDSVTVSVTAAGVPGCDRILVDSHPQASADLPAAVTVLDNCDGAPLACVGLRDEGAAMGEIVHDLAPGAEILFHTAFKSEADFADGIAELVACGAEVLVDDVIYPEEPMFQDGPIAQAVQTAVDGGVAYFSAAGNEGDRGVDEVYLDADPGANDPPDRDPAFPTDGTDLHDFDPGAGDNRFAAITMPAGCGVDLVLQWNDPYSGVLGPGASRDLDLYLCSTDSLALNSVPVGDGGPNLDGCDFDGMEQSLAIADDVQSCGGVDPPSGDPVEILSYVNNKGFPVTGYLGIEHYCGGKTGVRLRVVVFPVGCALSAYTFEPGIFDSFQIYGHTAAAGANAVAAVFYNEIDTGGAIEPPTGQIDVRPFSSLGGDLPFYFDGSGNPLAGAPVIRYQPQHAAPDLVNNSFFGTDIEPDGFPNFGGTSAAAPHAAAVAALMLDRNPTLTPQDVRDQIAATATDIEAGGVDPLSGAGLVDARAAVLAVPAVPIKVVSPGGIDYGAVEVGNLAVEEVEISNTGSADLHVASIVSSDGTAFSPAPGGSSPCASLTPTVAAGGSCTIEVTFDPSLAQHDETLTIQSDSAVDPTQIVTLEGNGFRICTSADNRVLPEPMPPVSGVVVEQACVSLTAGPYAIAPAGDVTFEAGETIVLLDGFVAEGLFTAVIDPLLVP